MRTIVAVTLSLLFTGLARVQPLELEIDFSKPDGQWDLPRFALGQGGLQSEPMLAPHVKELRQLRPRTIRLFLSEFYRIYPAPGKYDFSKLDRELRAIRAAGARPTLVVAMKPPVLYPKVDHAIVHPTDYAEWEKLCEVLARHCREEKFDVAVWEVANEPDIGESGGTPYLFKTQDYVTYYTHTVAGLLRGDAQAKVGGPTVAAAHSDLVDALIEHCAQRNVPLDVLSWHLYSDSPGAHAENVKRMRAKLARFPQLKNTKTFISEWNMDLMQPNLAPEFQPAFVLETVRRLSEAGLDMAAYYHVRDCFVDEADFDWMSPGGRNFMAHWWNTMPQYSALFDHHGHVRPAWYAFRLLGQFEGPRFAVAGEQGAIRAIACQREHRRHVLVWRYEGGGPAEREVRLALGGLTGGVVRVVALDAAAAVNTLKVLRFQGVPDLAHQPIVLKLRPWEIRWIEIE
ncbi:MAG: hypothetical protein ABSG68_19940 [Thermoguttaceae bacterium]|jgi:sugar phosphate isomerase/epimerase